MGIHSLTLYSIAFPEKIDLKLAKKLENQPIYSIEARKFNDENINFVQINPKILKKKSTNLKELIQNDLKKGINPIIIVNNAEELLQTYQTNLCNKIFEIYNLHKRFIQFLFIFYQEPSNEIYELMTDFGVTNYFIAPLRKDPDIQITLVNEEQWNNYQLSKEVKERIISLSGGYSAIARSLLSIYFDDKNNFLKLSDTDLIKNPIVSVWMYKIYNCLTEQSRQEIENFIINPKKFKINFSTFLIDSKIILKKDSYQFFSPLFEIFIKKLLNEKKTFSMKNKEIFYSNINIKNILSAQELAVFRLLFSKKNKFVSRENIAKAMWGHCWEKVYSNWAIDRLIYKLRKKFFDQEKNMIETSKGKGVRLSIYKQQKSYQIND